MAAILELAVVLAGRFRLHAEICDKALGQFLICVNVRVEVWGCAPLNVLHSGVERLPERRIGFNALLHHVGESFLLQ